MSITEYALLAFSSMFVIVDPIATVPAFLAMTPGETSQQRIRTARIACLVAGGVLVTFSAVGKWIFEFLGITMPAFQIAASLVLLWVALDMLRAQRSRVQETNEETAAGVEKSDVAVAPLAIPMLAGPGAISTALLLHNQAQGLPQTVAFYACVLLVCFVSYLIFSFAARSAKWLSPIAMNISTRIMGLLLAAVAIQFMLNAFKEIRATW